MKGDLLSNDDLQIRSKIFVTRRIQRKTLLAFHGHRCIFSKITYLLRLLSASIRCTLERPWNSKNTYHMESIASKLLCAATKFVKCIGWGKISSNVWKRGLKDHFGVFHFMQQYRLFLQNIFFRNVVISLHNEPNFVLFYLYDKQTG